MSHDDPTIPPESPNERELPSPSLFARIDQRCDEFEAAWKRANAQAGASPKIKDFLPATVEPANQLVLALVCIDVDYRRLAGEEPSLDDYQQFGIDIDVDEIESFRDETHHHYACETIPPKKSLEDSSTRPLGAVPSTNVANPAPQTTFGDYEIIEEIARGGMGIVFKARQKKLNRLCALKMILTGQFAGREELQRFYTEAESAANLQHPGIVPVFEVGEIDGQHFYSMGYVDGQSLSEKISSGPMAPKLAAAVTRQVSEAIAHAHDQKVIHRDLKPANVLIGPDGIPKVTDFGLAKKTVGESDLTATGQVLGTPSYMPPEQAAGDLEEVDEQSDLYSVGAILYCLMTGRPPFQSANPMDILLQVLEQEPVPPTKLNASIPRDLETICLKCLAKDKSKRYPSVLELVAELKRFEGGEPIRARPASRIERTVRWCRRHPSIAASIALATLLVISVMIAGPWIAVQQSRIATQQTEFASEQQRLKEQADLARAEEEEAREIATQAKEATEKTVYARTISLAYEEWRSNNVYSAEALLDQTDPSMRSWEWNYTKQLCNSEAQTLLGSQNVPTFVTMLDDGIHVAACEAASPNCATYVWDWRKGVVVAKHKLTGLAFSSDGRKFAALTAPRIGSQAKDQVGIYETLTGKQLLQIAPPSRLTMNASFSPDGSKLATCGNDSRVRTWDLGSGKMIGEVFEQGRRRTHPVFWSEDSRWLGWKMKTSGKIKIFDAQLKEMVVEAEDPLFRLDTDKIAIHRGKGLIASGGFGGINLFDIESGKKIGSLFGHNNAVTQLVFSNDGMRLFSAGTDATVRIWDIESRKEQNVLRGHKAGNLFGIAAISLAQNEEWLVSGGQDRTVKLWTVESAPPNQSDIGTGIRLPSDNQETQFLHGFSKSIYDAAVSPDGKFAAAAGSDRIVRVFDLRTRQIVTTFEGHADNIGAVAFHPNGNLIASGSGGINDRDGGRILIWKRESAEQVGEYKIQGPISGLSFLPNGKRLIAVSGSQVVRLGKIASIDLEQQKLENEDDVAAVRSIDVSPKGDRLAVVTAAGLVMYDLENEEFMWTKQETEAPAASVSFSPDGKRLAVGKATSQVGLFDVKSGDRLWHEIGHLGMVLGVQFFDNGKRIVSVGTDKTTKIWNAQTGDILLALRDDGFEKFGVEVHTNQQTLLVFGEAPYLTLRGHARRELEHDAQLSTLFSDDFERDEMGENWLVAYGDWRVQDGAAVGNLVTVPSVPGYISALISLKRQLPSYFEVEYDTWSNTPMLFQTNVSDTEARNMMSALYIGQPVPFANAGRQGVAISTFSNWAQDFSHATDKGFRFEEGRKYRLKTVFDSQSLKVYCDGEFITERQVPKGFLLNSLSLNSSFAQPGSEFHIDNVEIRIRDDEPTRTEMAAIELEYRLFEKLGSKSLVVNVIESDESLADDLKQVALSYANYRLETLEEQRAKFATLLLLGDASPDIYRAIEKSLRATKETNEADAWVTNASLAACYLRLNEFEQAIQYATNSDTQFLKFGGSRTPINAAILALSHAQLGNTNVAQQHFSSLHEMMRSNSWNGERALPSSTVAALAAAWSQQATENLDDAITRDILETGSDEEEILGITFEPFLVADLEFDTDAYFDSFSDSAVIVRGRTSKPNRYDIQIDVSEWKKSETLWRQGAAPLFASLTRDFVDVQVDGIEADVKADVCFRMPFGFWRVAQTIKLKKSDGLWKIVYLREGLSGLGLGKTRVDSDEDWGLLDEQVESVRQKAIGDPLQKRIQIAVALATAHRHQEAFDLLHELVGTEKEPLQEQTAFQFWHALSMYAWQLGDASKMKMAIEKSVKLNPKQLGPQYFAVAIADTHQPPDFADFGHGVRVKIPTVFEKGTSRDAPRFGTPLGTFYPSPTSVMSIAVESQTFASSEEFAEKFDQLVVGWVSGFKAQLHRKRLFKFKEFEAFDFILEGNGNGRSISTTTAATGSGTIQRMIGIRRESDFVVLSLTALRDEFDFRNSLFQSVIDRAEIE